MSTIFTEEGMHQDFRQAILVVFETNTGWLTPAEVLSKLPENFKLYADEKTVGLACNILVNQESLQQDGMKFQLD